MKQMKKSENKHFWRKKKLQKCNFHPKKRKWPKSAKQEFSIKKGLGSTYTPYWSLTSCKISKNSNVPILRNIQVSLFFIQKWPKMAKICKMRIFLKIGVGLNLYPLPLCKTSMTTMDPRKDSNKQKMKTKEKKRKKKK